MPCFYLFYCKLDWIKGRPFSIVIALAVVVGLCHGQQYGGGQTTVSPNNGSTAAPPPPPPGPPPPMPPVDPAVNSKLFKNI